MSNIYSVRELTSHIKGALEKNFPFVWVKGEVSNLARPSSGHMYFSLKDSDALLNCVWFKQAQRSEEKFDPLTGEVFEDGPRPSLAQSLKNGMEVLCAGTISVYAPRGSYQLTVSLMQEGGRGALFAAFEALKVKLKALGYFQHERKRALPVNPQRVAVVTAPHGAAIHDFLRIASTRGIGSQLRIYPVPVQGDMAAPTMVKTLRALAQQNWAQVIVLIRGGGSLEDLWAYNEEILAEAIFQSPIPVLAGIGHEVDISMADMTADMRAATPTHAAQLLWASREEYMQKIDGLECAVHSAGQGFLARAVQELAHKEQALKWLSPMQTWQRKEGQLRQFEQQLLWHISKSIDAKRHMLRQNEQKLPILLRSPESATAQVDALQLRLNHAMQRNFLQKEQNFVNVGGALPHNIHRFITKQHMALHTSTLQLQACDPFMPLSRGYALLQTEVDGKTQVVRSVQDVHKGQTVSLHVADGHIAATVQKTTKK